MPRNTEMIQTPPPPSPMVVPLWWTANSTDLFLFRFDSPIMAFCSFFHSSATGFLSLLISHFTLLYKCIRLSFCCCAAWCHFRNDSLFHNLRGICNSERMFLFWEKIFSNRQFWTVFYMWPATTMTLSIKLCHIQIIMVYSTLFPYRNFHRCNGAPCLGRHAVVLFATW
jgi:hypothetical protein